MAKYTDKQALDELKQAIDEIDNIRKKPRLSPKFKAWQIETSELLENLFGGESKQVKDFDRIPYSLAAFSNQTPDSKFDEAFHQGLKSAAISLSSVVKEIQANGVEGSAKQSKSPDPSNALPNPPSSTESIPVNKEINTSRPAPAPAVFTRPTASTNKAAMQSPRVLPIEGGKILVIGESANDIESDLIEFLIKIGLEPVSVRNKPDQHESLLKAAEENQDTRYAIVMLGFGKTAESKNDSFGLGVLVGRLGRDRVCAIVHDKSTSIDTYSCISYVPVDAAGAWKFMMIKNLKSAGFEVDANLAL